MSKLRSSPEEQAAKLTKSYNRYLAAPRDGLELLASLIAVPEGNKSDVQQKLTALKCLINVDFIELCKQDNLPNEAEMHGKLAEAVDELTELIQFSALANKTVVGIGGGFSAGKSSFINSLLRKKLLPYNVTPTTAIPTYLAQGNDESLNAINIFGSVVPVDHEAVQALCHDFHNKYKVQPKSFIRTLNVSTPDFPYKHLAFLDTPGYSKADGQDDMSVSDRLVALEQLRLAEVLIWVVDIANGTLRQSDIDFIRKAREQHDMVSCLPIFVVLNKADCTSPDDRQLVVEEVRNRLRNTGISCSGIVAYDSTSGKELARDGESISEYLDKIGRMTKPCRLPARFAEVFEAYCSHNKKLHVQLSEQLRFLNEFKVRMEGKLNVDEDKALSSYLADIKRKMGPLQGLVAQFESVGQKVDGLVTEILDELKVADEKPESLGVVGDVHVRDGNILAELKSGDKLQGSVVKTDFLGVYVETPLGEPILLFNENITEFYPGRTFHVGSTCEVDVVDIHRTNGDVKVVVTFA